MILYRMIAILSIIFFMAYADEKLNDIDAKVKECNDNNGSACYELGQYYSQSSEENSTNKALHYYRQGCKYNNQISCIEEVDYAIKKHFFSKHLIQKIVSVGDLHFQKKEYKKAFEYYTIAAQNYDSEALYKQSLTSIKLDTNISNAERYYFQYVQSVISHINFYSEHKILMRLRKTGVLELKFTLFQDGSMNELTITKPSSDDFLNKSVYASIQTLPKFHAIPFEFKKEKLIIFVPLELRLY